MNMLKKWVGLILFSGALFFGSAKADVLLLVHGYQGNIFSWEQSGVVPVLQQFGWKRAGVLLGAPQGLIPIPLPGFQDENKVINLQVNSEAPLIIQSNVVTAAIRWIVDHYPSEKIIIAGHSLGGVVARMALVRNGAPNVKALVTIASPHLGTALAYRGLDELEDPLPIRMIKEWFGGETYDMLQRSRGLLHDIVPAIPGRLLHWLNSRQHPNIKYYSVVRSNIAGVLGDPIVSGYSQDMKNVPPIGDRSTRLIQGFTHWLNVLDGYALVNILDQLDD